MSDTIYSRFDVVLLILIGMITWWVNNLHNDIKKLQKERKK
jgi:hypothetical protein